MDARGGFEPTGEETLFEGRVITLARASFRAPNGESFVREIVHHPGAVAVLPLHDDQSITMVRQFRAALGHTILEIPAGLRDVDGEPPIITASRELAEEVGLAAGKLAPLCVFHNSPGFADELVHVFLATDLHSVDLDRQGVEEQHMTIERIPLESVVARIDRGEITDAKTVLAVALVQARSRTS